MLSNALLQVHGQVIQLYMYIYPLLSRFLSHIDHHRALGRFPCTVQYVLTGYLFHLQWGVCADCVRRSVGERSVTPMRGECVCTHLSVCWCATSVTFKLPSFMTEKAQLPKPHPAASVYLGHCVSVLITCGLRFTWSPPLTATRTNSRASWKPQPLPGALVMVLAS